ncbi:MAG: class II fumarate hydratase [Desulfobacterales bacterium]|jgi:fumarate hydratase class II|nr:class II fumarate hydratase [Desulfobacterales bacterium]
MKPENPTRDETDALGSVRVPQHVYYGAQTQRAADNFPISGLVFPKSFIHALSLLKKCAAETNRELGLLSPELAAAIVTAANEVMAGKMADQFIVDVFQTGSGTSTNMNMNEVLASRANEILTGKKGGKVPVHPNDHVNQSQSSNDVIPSVIHMATLDQIKNRLTPALQGLFSALSAKAAEFEGIQKIGRTHLQDAVPISLGDEFSGYAAQIQRGLDRLAAVEGRLSELTLGGTAVGTGLNAPPLFADKAIARIASETGISFRKTGNHFQAQATQDTAVETSAILRTIATSLFKIANDIRWLSSGPRCGIGELTLPAMQPGSSIMPGKINPVIPEAVMQVAMQICGNDTTIMMAGQSGNFELNTALPVIAYNLLQSIELLSTASTVFNHKCVQGIDANRAACKAYLDKSLALATVLVPHIGYDRAAQLAKIAYEKGEKIPETARREKVLPDNILNMLFESK